MKPTFSMDAALGAPFALIRRRPLTVLGWGIAMFAVVAAIYAVMIPLFLRLPWGEGEAMMEAYTAEVMQLQAAINGLNIVMYLVMLVLANAVGRAVLSQGRRDPFLFMRLSMDEVRVAVVVVATFIGWYVALLVLILIGLALGAALWSAGQGVAIGVVVIYAVLVLIGAIVGWVRVSLMAPATLILGRFAFAEGWAIARGQVLKLIGMNLLVWLIYILSYLVFVTIVAAILVGGFFGQGLVWPSVVDSPLDLMPLVRSMTIPFLATLPIFALSFGFYMSLITAPSIVAARQLLDGAPLPAAPVVADAAVGDGLEPL
ncbi:hypothetical protein [Brevundimonas subvibrioides]|uniref:hypothetical protein n=1 Tax=Brevundimonas subvibrioides TaxID=74313 RepID=UPI0022B521E5|nr:hypothetical protein [Brevundimonas subvibrioides]